MFLAAEFVTVDSERDEKRYTSLLKVFKLKKEEVEPFNVVFTKITVGYWRKANSIHKWFVDNVQNGVDECQSSPVSRENLLKLKNACQDALANKSSSSKILPSANGFFFGNTEYNEDYFLDLADTIKIIDKVLGNSKFNDCTFYYQSSW